MPALERLELKIKAERSESLRAEYCVEQVCYLARTGETAACLQRLQDLRSKYGKGNYPRVSVWLMIADGVCSYFSDLSDGARDRFVRANSVSRAAKYDDLFRLSSAWLAHVDFNRSEYGSMAQHLLASKPDYVSRRDAADCRAMVVLGNASICAGAYSDAVRWHEHARRAAVELGDEPTIGAIMYNKATFNCLRVQTNAALGQIEEAPLQFLSLQVDSNDLYHRAAGNTSLQQLSLALRARQRVAAGDFLGAREIYATLIGSDLPTSHVDDVGLLRAEMALCLLKLHEFEDALALARSLAPNAPVSLSADSELVFWSCLKDVAAGCADDALANQVASPLRQAVQRFQNEKTSLKNALAEIGGALR